MLPIIQDLINSPRYHKLMYEDQWYMNFVIDPEQSTTIRTMNNVVLPEISDLGWVYISIANIFEDKLCSATRIVLGYLLSEKFDDVIQLPKADRDRRQLLNAFLALQDYKVTGKTNILVPLDMATSALIIKSAMYRCVTTMGMVGLSTSSTTVQQQMLEPISDSYTKLYAAALAKLPPAVREECSLSISRDELKKSVILPDFYGSATALLRAPTAIHKPYLEAKEELIPAHMRHLEWGKHAGEVLCDRDIVNPMWTCSLTGRNVGYVCTEEVRAEVDLEDGANFTVSKQLPGRAYHLPLIANTVHRVDSSLLVPWYQFAKVNRITTFTTHDAVNCTPSYLNQMRQIIAEQIVLAAYHSPVMSMAVELDLPLPVIGDFETWALNFKPHGFMG